MSNIKTKKELYKTIYNEAKEYLITKGKKKRIDRDEMEELIKRHMDDYNKKLPENMEDIAINMLKSIRNTQGMPNTITDERIDRIKDGIKELKGIDEFSPKMILEIYIGSNAWEEVLGDIEKILGSETKIDKNNPKSYWVRFSKSIISVSRFLSQFSDVDEFNEFVRSFYANEHTLFALPLLLAKEIHGFGFALACDFLKENGHPEFVKPDVHIMDIFCGIGLSRYESDYEVFKAVIDFSKEIDEKPYCVDKLFWLIGSGKFYLVEDENGKEMTIGRNKKEFIKIVKGKYGDEILKLTQT